MRNRFLTGRQEALLAGVLLAIAICLPLIPWDDHSHEEQAVAAVLMGEAWSEGELGMTAVAEVIHQRSKEKGWSPLRVALFHRGDVHAFSCLNGTTINRLLKRYQGERDFELALRIARTACHTPEDLPGITALANHYAGVDITPFWAQGIEPVAVVGGHAFYRLDRY